MRTLYIDCASGISGLRLIGALLDLKKDGIGEFDRQMSWLRRHGCDWSVDVAGVFSGVEVRFADGPHNGALKIAEAETLIAASDLPLPVRERSLAALAALKEAVPELFGGESETPLVGRALLFEVAGSLLLVDWLRIERVCFSPLDASRVETPLADRLLVGAPVALGGNGRTTLGGALLLKALRSSDAPKPEGTLLASACGGELGAAALRVALLEQNGEDLPYLTGKIVVMETNIDDMNPQDYQSLEERLFASGALDVFFTPIMMKKMRPAVRLTCISSVAKREKLGEVILRYSATIGLRWSEVNRMTLKRRIRKFESSFGPVSMKLSSWGEEVVRVTAEYEDLKRISQETGCPLEQLRPLVISEFRQKEDLKKWI